MKLSFESWGNACEGAWKAVKNCCCGEEVKERPKKSKKDKETKRQKKLKYTKDNKKIQSPF